MFSDKALQGEVKALQRRLEELEHSALRKQIQDLKDANSRIEASHHEAMDRATNANHKLGLRVSKLQGIAITLLAVLSGIALYYFSLYQKETENRPISDAILVDVFQNRLDHTIERISLLNPSPEDKILINELNDAKEQWRKVVGSNQKFVALSDLAQILKQIVIEHKAQEARTQLTDVKMLTIHNDRFISSRASLLEAISFHTDGECKNPNPTVEQLTNVLQKDSGLVAAINLRGICLAQKSRDLLAKGPEALKANPGLWEESVQTINAALLDNKFAYEFNPSNTTRIRFLNNKVWNSMQFLAGAMKLGEDKPALQLLGRYQNLEAFSEDALRALAECYLLARDKATHLETEAELHALECTYYSANKDDERAKTARELMIKKLTEALANNLLNTRQKSTFEEAAKYFMDDSLLKPLFADPKDYRTIDPKIKQVIEQLLDS